MALQFIMGNSGSGKTYFIQQKLIQEAERNPKKNYLYIVPEQYTMQTQRELVDMHEKHSIMNIDILSFQRLAYRIFDELGCFHHQVLEETGKNLILRKIAEEKSEELIFLQRNMKKMGYIDEVKSLISELSQYKVSPNQLENILLELPKGSFSAKLSDVIKMYQGFMEYLEGKFVTAEEILELLYSVADSSEIIRDSIIVFDGFTGFTPIQNHLLGKLLTLAEQVYVTVTIDRRENPYHYKGAHELFSMSKKMVTSLIELAGTKHIEVEEPVWLEAGEKSRFSKAKALHFLEQNLFRHRGAKYLLSEEEKQISIYSLLNPREEMGFVAREIQKLVRSGEYYYRDIAIVCGNLEGYANYAKEVFALYDIPLFVDQKTNIVYHPFIEFLEAVLEVLQKDFSQESIFRYLRCGLSGIEADEVDILENYCLAANIRGYKKWLEKFCYIPKSYGEEELEVVNVIREKVIKQFETLHEQVKQKNATVLDFTNALYRFVCEREIEQQLQYKKKEYEEAGDLKNALEYSQIYRIVMDIFDKMTELLGEEHISLEEYGKILESGFQAAKVGIIPPGYDRVVFGDIERSRLTNIKILFFAGVNDGIIPKSKGSDGILSQTEREQLSQMHIELAPTAREKTFMQRFYLYLNLTKPSGKLYLTYARVSGDGSALRSSYLIHSILKMYENLSVQEIDKEEFAGRIVTAKSGIGLLIEGLESASLWEKEQNEKEQSLWAALCRWYEKDETWKEKIENLYQAARMEYKETPISSAVTRVLYGTVLENSVTRLERFASCSFAHFMTYGLGLKERETGSFATVDIGNIFHEVLEIFASAMEKEGYDWFSISKEDSDTLLESALEQAIGANHNIALYDTARSSYAKERMHRIMKRTVWALLEQIRQGRFVPENFEVSFAYVGDLNAVNFQLSEEEKMHLRGRIDRIDTCEDKDKLYVKVIDYKSGGTTFQLLNIYHGLQLQLVVYMNAALEMMQKRHKDKEILPAGVFYYKIDDPIVEEDKELSEAELRDNILRQLKLDGVLNSDRSIAENLDVDLPDGTASKVIPARIKKDGCYDSNSKVMSTEAFAAMSAYVNETIVHLGQKMLQGDISISPYSLGKNTGCDYCEYHGICQFDKKIAGYEHRRLEEYSNEEILDKMMKGAGE